MGIQHERTQGSQQVRVMPVLLNWSAHRWKAQVDFRSGQASVGHPGGFTAKDAEGAEVSEPTCEKHPFDSLRSLRAGYDGAPGVEYLDKSDRYRHLSSTEGFGSSPLS
jgi:hypothetical protein